ncbi:MAG: hypothetical protein IT583_03725 [Verrucomicrobia bacterium]|nr:hypothetical protein [Verrucomicrobiota bacterium]
MMLSNMLIYLGVVLFTFNLLDPSKIDASYLAKRGFTSRPEPKTEQDTAFQKLSDEKRQQQAQPEIVDTAKLGMNQEPSAANRLSQIEPRKLGSSLPQETEKPQAALTESSRRSGNTAIRTAPSRLYSVAIYPQNTMPFSYSPLRILTPRALAMETYEVIPVEMAIGINYPTFSLPTPDSAGAYLYRPANPIPEASRGGLKLSSPPTGAESLYTNDTRKAEKISPSKDRP